MLEKTRKPANRTRHQNRKSTVWKPKNGTKNLPNHPQNRKPQRPLHLLHAKVKLNKKQNSLSLKLVEIWSMELYTYLQYILCISSASDTLSKISTSCTWLRQLCHGTACKKVWHLRRLWQYFPAKPVLQRHSNVSSSVCFDRQMPPFWQGEEQQGHCKNRKNSSTNE